MRLVFLALVLANVAFFAWSRHYAPDKTAADANPLARQVEPEKLKIVPPGELRPPPPAPKPAAAAALPLVACLEWGSFTVSDYPRAEKALEPLALGSRLAQRRTEEVAGWWVHMPPQGSRQAALRKSGELKALGVQDYFIVAEDGEWRWALSLGVYRTEEAAQARLAAPISRRRCSFGWGSSPTASCAPTKTKPNPNPSPPETCSAAAKHCGVNAMLGLHRPQRY
jgi:hypothetical protein